LERHENLRLLTVSVKPMTAWQVSMKLRCAHVQWEIFVRFILALSRLARAGLSTLPADGSTHVP